MNNGLQQLLKEMEEWLDDNNRFAAPNDMGQSSGRARVLRMVIERANWLLSQKDPLVDLINQMITAADLELSHHPADESTYFYLRGYKSAVLKIKRSIEQNDFTPPTDLANTFIRGNGKSSDVVAALEKLRSYNVEIAARRINYRPEDHLRVIGDALEAYLAEQVKGKQDDRQANKS